MRRAGGLLLALAALGLAGCGENSARRDGVPRDFFGIVADDVFARNTDYRLEMLARQRAAGIGLIRQTFDWSLIEVAPGRYDWDAYDGFVATAARAGMDILPVIFQPPEFHSSRPAHGAERGTYPPEDPAVMGRFARELVERYGPNGTLWEERDDVPRTPIREWQVWNEPNFHRFWPSGPDAAEYSRLLRVTSRAIKEADPEARVVSAGLPHSKRAIPPRDFVIAMHQAGATESYDSLAVHVYAPTAAESMALVHEARRLLDDIGSEASIWATELGWATQGPESPFTLGPEGQAEQIRDFLTRATDAGEEVGLRGIVYYKWRDTGRYPGGPELFGLHSGLLRRDGTAKPAYAAFADVAQPDK